MEDAPVVAIVDFYFYSFWVSSGAGRSSSGGGFEKQTSDTYVLASTIGGPAGPGAIFLLSPFHRYR